MRRRITTLALLLATSLALQIALRADESQPAENETVVYLANRILTGTPSQFPPQRPGLRSELSNGVLVVRGGKIVQVSDRTSREPLPENARVVDLGNRVIIPGLVAAETSLAEGGRDDVETFTPSYRALDGFDFFADRSALLAGGVTAVQVAPGTRRLLPGQGAVVKLAGTSLADRTLRESESLRVLLGDAFKNAPRIYEPPVGADSDSKPLEPTRPQLGGGLAGASAGLRLALSAARSEKDKPQEQRSKEPALQALMACLEQRQPLRVSAPTTPDLLAALNLAREYSVRLILVDVSPDSLDRDQWRDAKEWIAGVIVSPGFRPGVVSDEPLPDPDLPPKRTVLELLRDLREVGIPTALKPERDADLPELLYLAYSTAGNMGLELVTRGPAEILGVGGRVGTLSPGRDADFVVLSGEPRAPRTRVEEVYVAGRRVWQRAPAGGRRIVQGIRVGDIQTQQFSQPVQIFIENGKIRSIGQKVSAPLDTEVEDFSRSVILPGFIDLGTGLGFGGAVTQPVPLGQALAEKLVSGDPAMEIARRGGVTTVLFTTTQGNAVSPVIAFKLTDTPQLLKEPVALRAGLSGNLTQAGGELRNALRAGKTYADNWNKYTADLAEYEKKKAEYEEAKKKLPAEPKKEEKPATEKKEESAEAKKAEGEKQDEKKAEQAKPTLPPEPRAPSRPQTVANLEPYRELFAGRIPLFVEARRVDAIALAVQIARTEFPVRLILVGADDAFRMQELLIEKEVAVAAGPTLVRQVERQPVNLPQVLASRAVPFGFLSQATTGVKSLPRAVEYAVRQGLSSEDALQAFTARPAELLQLDRIGQLAPGKDADLVVLSGQPFQPGSRVIAVMIDGEWVYRESLDR